MHHSAVSKGLGRIAILLFMSMVVTSAWASTTTTNAIVSASAPDRSQQVNPPSDDQNAAEDDRDALRASPSDADEGQRGEIENQKKKGEGEGDDGDRAPWIVTIIGTFVVALVGVLGGITGLFVGRSTHGLNVGRLALSPLRIDLSGRRALIRIRNTGGAALFSVRIEGACSAGSDASDFQTLILEEIEAGREIVVARPFVSGRRFVFALADGPRGRPDVFLRASYTDHADRTRSEVRDYALDGNKFRLLRSKTRLFWNSVG